MADLKLESIQPWAPHPLAAPLTEKNGDTLAIAANGIRTCVGGWQLTFSGVVPGRAYRVDLDVEHQDVERVRDSLQSVAYWGQLPAVDADRLGDDVLSWEYLLPEQTGEHALRFRRDLTAPEGADRLTLRYTFRWTTQGTSVWHLPRIEAVAPPASPRSVQVVVVTGRAGSRQGPFETIQDNLDFYVPRCEAACAGEPDLIVLPEIALQWGISGSALDLAVPAPGPETEVFADLARRHQTRLMLGMLERDGDAVHNSAVLIAPDGSIDGTYRKVHLAVGSEMDSGILPGAGFSVFETEIGRIGCNICMDSSAAESSRMVGLNGADFLLLPIMGDHRAWHVAGERAFDPVRFQGIMQTRAMDNQLCMVVAVNRTIGSCIVDRVGNVLAWNDGDQEFIRATVTLNDGYRVLGSKGCFRGVNWMQRRPHLYQAFADESNKGSLSTVAY